MKKRLNTSLRTLALSLIFSTTVLYSTAQAADTMKKVTAIIETNLGKITLELNPAKAPLSVANFIEYAKSGYYEGTVFHRVIKGFMVQGGGFTILPSGKFEKKATREAIKIEADNGLKNEVGTIAMARTFNPNSATAQFFFNVSNNGFLNHSAKTQRGWGYTVFGRITSGMDIVSKIEQVKTGAVSPFPKDVPISPITITKVTIK